MSDKNKVPVIKDIIKRIGNKKDDCSNVIYIGDGLTDYYEIYKSKTDPLVADSDNDGMPDSWEMTQLKALGATKATIADFNPSSYNITGKYTNLEVYLNELVVKTFPSGAGAANIK